MPSKHIQRQCSKHGLTEFVLEGRGYYRCKKCRVGRVGVWRRRVKAKLVERFGGGCEICGYDRCIRSLHFHHADPQLKVFGLSRCGETRSWIRVLTEAQKCVLLCSNCHGEVEEGIVVISDDIMKRAEDGTWLLDAKEFFYQKPCRAHKKEMAKKPKCYKLKRRGKTNKFCEKCNKPISKASTRCQSCSNETKNLAQRKVVRPEMDVLEKMIWEMPTTKIAEKYGVSDVAVAKWAKSYGIEKPSRGYWAARTNQK